MENRILEAVKEEIMKAQMSEQDRDILLRNLATMQEEKVNLLITGATGCGKSSTINALFNTKVAMVGVGADPETMDIEKYELGNLTIWDSPGLGDGVEADRRHAQNIIDKLQEKDENGHALIDLVLVLIDGSGRALGTEYELINKVIIPNLGPNARERILVAINQADMAMKGRNWDYEKNEPKEELVWFLEEKVQSVRRRIWEVTQVDVNPIYYSAGYTAEDGTQNRPYNLSKLLYHIVNATPSEKRAVVVDQTNENEEMWEDDDEISNYSTLVQQTTIESIVGSITKGSTIGAEIGEKIGAFFGPMGATVGRFVGKIAGGVIGFFRGFF